MNQLTELGVPVNTPEILRDLKRETDNHSRRTFCVARLSVRSRPVSKMKDSPFITLMWLNLNFQRTGLTIDGHAEILQTHFNSAYSHREARMHLNKITDEQVLALIGPECPVQLRSQKMDGHTPAGTRMPTWELVQIGTMQRRMNGSKPEWYFIPVPNVHQILERAEMADNGKYRGQVINLDLHSARAPLAHGLGWKLNRMLRDNELEFQVQHQGSWKRILKGDVETFHQFSNAIEGGHKTRLKGAYGLSMHNNYHDPALDDDLPELTIETRNDRVIFHRVTGGENPQVMAHNELSLEEAEKARFAIDQQCVAITARKLAGEEVKGAINKGT